MSIFLKIYKFFYILDNKYNIKNKKLKQLKKSLLKYEKNKKINNCDKLFLEVEMQNILNCNISYSIFKQLCSTNSFLNAYHYYIRGSQYLNFNEKEKEFNLIGHKCLLKFNFYFLSLIFGILLITSLILFIYGLYSVYSIGYQEIGKIIVSVLIFFISIFFVDQVIKIDSAMKLEKIFKKY